MDKSEDTTLSFVLTQQIIAYLRERAKLEDRSLSAVLRRILETVIINEPLPQAEPGPGQLESAR